MCNVLSKAHKVILNLLIEAIYYNCTKYCY